MSQPPQPPFSGEPQPGEPYPGQSQPYPGQPQYPATPYPGPYSGQPNPDVPSSVPPQPGYPYAPYPGFAPPAAEPPKAKSRTLPIVLTSVAIFLVLCLGGSTAVVLVFKNQDDKLTAADTTPSPATTAPPTEEPTPDPTTKPAATVKIVEPKTLGGRPKVSTKELKSYVDLLKTMMSSYPSASKSVSGMYGRIGTRNVVVMAAAEADVVLPETTVDALLASGGSSTKVTGITSVPAGSLGGSAKCGNSSSAGEKLAICVWADQGSLGLVVWYFKSSSAIKSEFPKVRAEIEKKA
jgi:hypothetical protein